MQTSRHDLVKYAPVLLVACVALGVSGCIENQAAPGLTGPSGVSLSLTMTPTPQELPRDGTSQALVTLRARNEIANTPIAFQRLTLIVSPSTATLSVKEVTTSGDGLATFTVTAPPADATDAAISIVATPVAGVSDSVSPARLSIRLNGDVATGPAARFTLKPTQPHVGEQVAFDASASTAMTGSVITTYAWDFGDGNQEATTTPTIGKVYDEARIFAVTLTVTDNLGGTSTTAQTVTVAP